MVWPLLFTLSFLALTIFHHELWVMSCIAGILQKQVIVFPDLISNTRYEGHPPFWYSILWIVSKFTHDVSMIQVGSVDHRA
jgi:hypothetical protein